MNNLPKRVVIYRLTIDHGMAPNPFHGVCTLGLCTPNHMRRNMHKDDVIIGLAGNGLKKQLGKDLDSAYIIYCMQIDERMELDDYFGCSKYQMKKPDARKGGIWEKGDNFYHKDESGKLVHLDETLAVEHLDEETMNKDINGNRVWISKRFTYWGRKMKEVPKDYEWGRKLVSQENILTMGAPYIYGGTSRYGWTQEELIDFMKWISETIKFQSLIANPISFTDDGTEGDEHSCSPASSIKPSSIGIKNAPKSCGG